MKETIEINIDDHQLTLLPTGGVFHRATNTLFVTDTHFGKDATFRKHSIPVPSGSTLATISKIKSLVQRTSAQQLVILGDMFHAASSFSQETNEIIDEFTTHDCPHLRISLVPGNHDKNLPNFPRNWKIHMLESTTTWGGLVLSHFPLKSNEKLGPVLCGHIHPAVHVGSHTDRLKLPCFLHRKNHLVLPAIGDFTGTKVIRPRSGDRIWLVADQQVISWRN